MNQRLKKLLELLFLTALSVAIGVPVTAQSIPTLKPALQKQLGGPGFDYPYSIITASNGDLLVACTSDSIGDGGSYPNNGGEDFVLWRLDTNLNVRWVRSFGGSGNDRLFDLAEASNGDVLLVGRSASPISGTKTSPHFGGNDIWVVMLDSSGQQRWQRTFGGDGDDRGLGVLRLPSDEFVIVGQSSSAANTVGGGKALPNYGLADAYAVCVTASGVQRWEVCYGGLDVDDFRSAVALPTGEIVLIGSSASPTGGRANKTAPLVGTVDLFCVAIDAKAQLLWQKTYGEIGHEFSCDTRGAVGTPKGGFVLSTTRGMPLGPISDPNTAWLSSGLVLVFDAKGQLVSQQQLINPNAKVSGEQFGVDGIYLSRVIALREGGYLVSGGTDCVAGGIQTQNAFGFNDALFVQLDDELKPTASLVMGGVSNEWTPALTQRLDGTVCAAIESYSGVGGNKTVPAFGSLDGWLVTLITHSPPASSTNGLVRFYPLIGNANNLIGSAGNGTANNTSPAINHLGLPGAALNFDQKNGFY
jgi:hypothetical protein